MIRRSKCRSFDGAAAGGITGRISVGIRRVPAVVRFLSCEPLLGPLTGINLTSIHWVIAGGESGPRARPPCV